MIDKFIGTLCDNSNSELIMFRKHLLNKTDARRKFIADLDIPTFKNFKNLMFFDVLLALIRAKCAYRYK